MGVGHGWALLDVGVALACGPDVGLGGGRWGGAGWALVDAGAAVFCGDEDGLGRGSWGGAWVACGRRWGGGVLRG